LTLLDQIVIPGFSNKNIENDLMNHMPSHGDCDESMRQWYCSYWMTKEEWLDIHDYSPTDILHKHLDSEQ
jgi:hypothetical protein